jgi:hypothetical protein
MNIPPPDNPPTTAAATYQFAFSIKGVPYKSVAKGFNITFGERTEISPTALAVLFSMTDDAAFKEACDWVFGEYADVFRNLAA